ncbi:hypothetical protein HDU85_000383 [Gaertneriomyces sp. JEL0708]|nr:hypothetical protein HDU85_000383 [Gaertneriomyces sp. JEL0708]
MSSYLTFIVKSVVYSTGIIGGGWLLLKATVPSNEEMKKILEENGRVPSDMSAEQRRMKKFAAMLKENAESDRPIWDIKWYVK